MKIIGWALIIVGIISILQNGMYFTFEGIVTALVPIIGGIILLVKASKKE